MNRRLDMLTRLQMLVDCLVSVCSFRVVVVVNWAVSHGLQQCVLLLVPRVSSGMVLIDPLSLERLCSMFAISSFEGYPDCRHSAILMKPSCSRVHAS